MGQHDNKIKRKSKQLLWLLMALFCVVFSGAIKKVIQLHADHKMSLHVHRDVDGSRPPTQNIKDGPREKHEIQVLVSSVRQASPLRFFPSSNSVALNVSSELLNLYTWISCRNSYNNRKLAASGIPLPLYIFARNFRV